VCYKRVQKVPNYQQQQRQQKSLDGMYQGINYYQYSLIVSSFLVIITFITFVTLYCIRWYTQRYIEPKHSKVSDQSTTLYDVFKPRDNMFSKFVIMCIELNFFTENAVVILFVLSCLSYLGAATAFGYVFWGISFSVSVIIIVIVSLHTFRYRNIRTILRKKDFLEQEVAYLLEENRKVDPNEWGKKEVELAPIPPTIEEPALPNTEQYHVQKLRPEDLGKFKYILLEILTRWDVYFRSIEIGITKYRLFAFIMFLILNLLLATFISSFFYGTCICVNPYQFSTTFTRFVNPNPCNPQQVCALMLNLPEVPSREMIIKFYSTSEPVDSFILYGTTENSTNENAVNCSTTNLNQLQRNYKELFSRYMFTCNLKNLEPDQVYYFQAVYTTLVAPNKSEISNITNAGQVLLDVYSPIKKFKTLHESPAEVVWVTGGDMGISSRAAQLLKQAAQLEPDFIAITGNIAYDNGFLSCTERWLDYFAQYQDNTISSSGLMIPILTSIGNYEARYHRYNSSRDDIVPYLNVLSFSISQSPSNQTTYHIHNLANHTSLTVLDSGITVQHADQVQFLNSNWISQSYQPTRKFVMYHNPLYPTVSTKFTYLAASGIKYWQPLFDQFNVVAAFEGNDCTMKRTKTIYANQVSNHGTVYLGDGSFGVMETNNPEQGLWYIEKASNTPHFWLVRSSPNSTQIEGIDLSGNIVDSVLLP
jgi:hypothetical protein